MFYDFCTQKRITVSGMDIKSNTSKRARIRSNMDPAIDLNGKQKVQKHRKKKTRIMVICVVIFGVSAHTPKGGGT